MPKQSLSLAAIHCCSVLLPPHKNCQTHEANQAMPVNALPYEDATHEATLNVSKPYASLSNTHFHRFISLLIQHFHQTYGNMIQKYCFVFKQCTSLYPLIQSALDNNAKHTKINPMPNQPMGASCSPTNTMASKAATKGSNKVKVMARLAGMCFKP